MQKSSGRFKRTKQKTKRTYKDSFPWKKLHTEKLYSGNDISLTFFKLERSKKLWSDYFKTVLFVFPHNPARIPKGDNIWRNVFCNNTSGSDNNIVSNANSGQNDNPASDPNIITNFHRRCLSLAKFKRTVRFWQTETINRICRMKSRVDLDIRSDQSVVTDNNLVIV